MRYRPRIKNNICTNAHPVGCYFNVYSQMLEAIDNSVNTHSGQTALVVGSSSGVGLASRLALTFAAGMDTIGIYCDRAAQAHKYGSAGWYNNQAFEYYARRANKMALSSNQDAFQKNAKDWVIQKLLQNDKKIDVLVYSLAASKRNVKGVAEYISAIKPVDEDYQGLGLDVFDGQLRTLDIATATPEEVDATVKVMGGEDWQDWVMQLKKAGVLAENFKTVAYSYSGPAQTQSIYGQGTLGCAKTHLHETALALTDALSGGNGQAHIAMLQASITPSSSVIPSMPLYISILNQQQKLANKYQTTLQHVSRLFDQQLLSGQQVSPYLRVDDFEHEASVQQAVAGVYKKLNQGNLTELVAINEFKQEFLQQFGFDYDFINYDQKPDPLTPPAIHDFSDLAYQKAG